MQVIVEGKAYKSMLKACEAYNASRNKVRRLMISENKSAEDAILCLRDSLEVPSRIRRIDTDLPDEVIGFTKKDYVFPISGRHYESFVRMILDEGFTSEYTTVLTFLEKAYKMAISKNVKYPVLYTWNKARRMDRHMNSVHETNDLYRQLQARLDISQKLDFDGAMQDVVSGKSIDEAFDHHVTKK